MTIDLSRWGQIVDGPVPLIDVPPSRTVHAGSLIGLRFTGPGADPDGADRQFITGRQPSVDGRPVRPNPGA